MSAPTSVKVKLADQVAPPSVVLSEVPERFRTTATSSVNMRMPPLGLLLARFAMFQVAPPSAVIPVRP